MRVAIGQLAVARNVETVHLGPRAAIGIADNDDLIVADQHFIIPGRAGVLLVGREGVDRIDRGQSISTGAHGEQPPSPQHDEVVARVLDDTAFIDARFLRVGDAFCFRCSVCCRLRHRWSGGCHLVHDVRWCLEILDYLFLILDHLCGESIKPLLAGKAHKARPFRGEIGVIWKIWRIGIGRKRHRPQ